MVCLNRVHQRLFKSNRAKNFRTLLRTFGEDTLWMGVERGGRHSLHRALSSATSKGKSKCIAQVQSHESSRRDVSRNIVTLALRYEIKISLARRVFSRKSDESLRRRHRRLSDGITGQDNIYPANESAIDAFQNAAKIKDLIAGPTRRNNFIAGII